MRAGGQKHRIALARACYAEADVVLLDDPLSAVDAHVGRHLMQHAVCGTLASATRLLVTHQLQFLPEADVVIKLEKGRLQAFGTYSELLGKGVKFDELDVDANKTAGGEVEEEEVEVEVEEETQEGTGEAGARKSSFEKRMSERASRKESQNAEKKAPVRGPRTSFAAICLCVSGTSNMHAVNPRQPPPCNPSH
jgi:ABC-type sulfate/molybdate transport systems ATPase subunit